MIIKEKEYETKVLISKKTFHNLLKNYKLNITNNTLIKNNYFDTNDLDVFSNSGVFRVRETKGKFIVTFKRALKENELVEYNQIITKKRFSELKQTNFANSKFKKILDGNNIDIESVGFLGSLITHRWKIRFNGANIFIDHCIYNDNEDYEIECEAKSARDAQDIIKHFCEKHGISISIKTLSKYARFLRSRTEGY